MRRLLLMAAALLAALTLSVPGAALASHGHRHHHKRHPHHAKVRFLHLGTTTTGSSPGAPSAPTTAPAATENAGKVVSYTGGVLTLTLTDGSSVAGKVTNRTRIECVSATAAPPGVGAGNENGPGDDNGAGDDNHQGDQNQGQGQGQGQNQGQGQGQGQGNQPSTPGAGAPAPMHGEDAGDDDGEEGQAPSSEPPCDSSALTAGAIVRQAELRIGASGNEFESIELVR